MNISQMMRGLLGDVTSGDTRAMELKVGQIVRGVVLQTLENNEAIVGINGVQVRAKLEMALQPGQSAMLQVQPESNGALVLLKAVDLNTSGLLDDTFREYAKLLGLPDQKWALALIRSLRQEGFAFNRTTAAAFQQAAAAMPKGADAEQWMSAAATAFKRGMPMTATTISSLQQVMFGKPAHELMDQLQRQLVAMGVSADAPGGSADDGTPQPAARVLALLQQGAALLEDALEPSKAGATNRPAAEAASQQPDGRVDAKGQAEAAITARSAAASDDQAGGWAARQNGGSASQGQIAAPANWLGQMMKWMGVDHELQLAKAATEAGAPSASGQPAAAGAEDGEAAAPARAALQGEAPSGGARNAASAASPQSAQSAQQGAVPAPQMTAATAAATAVRQDAADAAAKPPSVDGPEPQAAVARADGQGTAAARLPGLLVGDGPSAHELAQPAQGHNAANASGGGAATESLKSALMSLASGADVPPHVKDTAQQLVHQITGQQLLLAPERNSSVFTHVTMFIPLKDASGEQTASVQIQTRRGRRGELDADNCRLLFNLSMRSLGDTLVDVQITDKIVSLQLWNDHPAIAGLVEDSRVGMSERLGEMGYQLLSMRTKPLPKHEAAADQESALSPGSAAGKPAPPPGAAWLTAARYKGVDYRA